MYLCGPDLRPPTFVTPIPGRSPNFPWTLFKIPGHLKKIFSLATLARISKNIKKHTRNCHIDAKNMSVQGIPGRLVKITKLGCSNTVKKIVSTHYILKHIFH